MSRFRDYCFSLTEILSEAFFVNVGANDGVTETPAIRILMGNQNWKGLLIEPVPYCFDALKKNFSDAERYILEPVAIGANRGKTTFFYVDPAAPTHLSTLPNWWDKLGSFRREHILEHLGPAIEPFIRKHEVEVYTLAGILQKNGFEHVHLLHIDAEGYDYEILKSLDFDACTPVMIYIEHIHLSSSDKAEMRRLLTHHGYSLSDCGMDYFALNKRAYKRLKRDAQRAQ